MNVDFAQLDRLKREVKKLKPTSPEYAKRMGQINKSASKMVTDEAQSLARSSGKRYMARAAKAIKPSASTSGLSIRIAKGGDVPFALAAFWGMQRRSGWYAAQRYAASTGRQVMPWVGNAWEPGDTGGPYAINPAIRRRLPEVMTYWAEEIAALADELNI